MTLFSYSSRCLVSLSGKDVTSFLQGLITNDITLLESQPILYTALLTPQGRYLFDFFIFKKEGIYYCLIECARKEAWIKTLTRYKLRSDVSIQDLSDDFHLSVATSFSQETFTENVFFQAQDPRTKNLGTLIVSNEKHPEECSEEIYKEKRYQLSVAEGSAELTPEKSIILEYHFDERNALSWTKGCYMGQELMARTKHRGGLHKLCFGLEIQENVPCEQGFLYAGDIKVGKMICRTAQFGLGLLRLEHLPLIKKEGGVSFGENGLANVLFSNV